jgi:hypothetical protein
MSKRIKAITPRTTLKKTNKNSKPGEVLTSKIVRTIKPQKMLMNKRARVRNQEEYQENQKNKLKSFI